MTDAITPALQPFVAVAVRATSGDTETARLTELGLVQIGGGRIVDSWALRFDPCVPGLVVPDGDAFALHARAIANFGRGRKVIAWNTMFSVALLRWELRRCRIEAGARPPIDLWGSLAQLEPELAAKVGAVRESTPAAGRTLDALVCAAEGLDVPPEITRRGSIQEVLHEAALSWCVFGELVRRHPRAYEERHPIDARDRRSA